MSVRVDPTALLTLQLGQTLNILTQNGDSVSLNPSTGAGSVGNSLGSVGTIGQPSEIQIDPNMIRVGPTNGGIGTDYNFSQSGATDSTTTGFLGLPIATSFSLTSAEAGTTESAANSSITFDNPSGTPNPADIGLIGTISVVNLGVNPDGSPLYTDPTGAAAGGLITGSPDLVVTMPNINLGGAFNNSPGEIATGGYEPGNQITISSFDSLTSQLLGQNSAPPVLTSPIPDGSLADTSTDSNLFQEIDPLVLDLNGDGISLSNWIDNNVYFQSNVVFNATTRQATSDDKLHHTSWVNPDDGILALDLNGDGKIDDITETLSEYFQGGSIVSPGTYTPWTDGLAALASLAQSGATSFSESTSLKDPNTGKTYFDELVVWQDANQDGVSQASELHSLASLGITSISLVGTGNQGEVHRRQLRHQPRHLYDQRRNRRPGRGGGSPERHHRRRHDHRHRRRGHQFHAGRRREPVPTASSRRAARRRPTMFRKVC